MTDAALQRETSELYNNNFCYNGMSLMCRFLIVIMSRVFVSDYFPIMLHDCYIKFGPCSKLAIGKGRLVMGKALRAKHNEYAI